MTSTKQQTLQLIELGMFILVVVILILQALHPAWRSHSMVDGFFAFYNKMDYFFTNGTLSGIPVNEYQPGAQFFFLAISPVLLINYSREMFLNGLILLNLGLIVGLGLWLRRKMELGSLALFSLILWSGGPLLVFRFELYTHLVTAAAIWLWTQRKDQVAYFLLGVATSIKVYPVLLLPLLLIEVVRKRQLRMAVKHIIAFSLGIVAVVLGYMTLFRVSLAEVIQNLTLHSAKPLHIESVSGSLTSLVRFMSGQTTALENNLIYGVHPSNFFFPLEAYLYFWIIPVLLFTVWMLHEKISRSDIWISCLGLLLVFLCSVSQLGPQYLYWALLMIPFIPNLRSHLRSPLFLALIFWSLITLAFNQAVFPLFYSSLIDFYGQTKLTTGFYMLILRNLSLIITTAVTLWHIATAKHETS